jgi:hypothetical protein
VLMGDSYERPNLRPASHGVFPGNLGPIPVCASLGVAMNDSHIDRIAGALFLFAAVALLVFTLWGNFV